MLSPFAFLFLMLRRPPRPTRTDTLFPYPTLFRSARSWSSRQAFRLVCMVPVLSGCGPRLLSRCRQHGRHLGIIDLREAAVVDADGTEIRRRFQAEIGRAHV